MKKNKKWKLFLGVFTVMSMTLTVPIMAKPLQKNIGITYDNIKMYINGGIYTPKNGSEPFIYKGTVYLPVRAVGDAFEEAVSWDSKNKSVYIGSIPNSTSPDKWLDEMKVIS